MNRIICFLIFATFFNSGLFSQELNQKFHDPSLDKEVLIGYCDLNGLRWGEFRKPMLETYEEYIGDEKAINKIKDNWQDVKITIVFATWCHDCQEQVPKFLNLLEETGFDNSNLSLIAVDRKKTAGELDISDLNIEKVPTMIFYRNNQEIGRINETPKKSLEHDTFKIIKN
ncbi:thioredoxin family protein [Bacteroidota bacterium]